MCTCMWDARPICITIELIASGAWHCWDFQHKSPPCIVTPTRNYILSNGIVCLSNYRDILYNGKPKHESIFVKCVGCLIDSQHSCQKMLPVPMIICVPWGRIASVFIKGRWKRFDRSIVEVEDDRSTVYY